MDQDTGNSQEIQQKIIQSLKTFPRGASSSTLAKAITHNRVTIAKYLEILKAQGVVEYEGVAQAKMWQLTEKNRPVILVVDDEKHVVKLIKLTLQPQHYTIKEAYSGREALAYLNTPQQLPDLIILDLMMPEISGYDLLEAIKSLPRKIPTVILSAKGEDEDKIKSFAAGALSYITKPFDPEELSARVAYFLRKTKEANEKEVNEKEANEKTAERYIREAVFRKSHQFFHTLELKNSEQIAEKYGVKKLTTFITILTKMLQEKKVPDTFICHNEIKEQFIFITNEEDLLERAKETVYQTAEYCFANGSPSAEFPRSELHMEEKSLSQEQIENEKIYIDDVLTFLQV